MKIAVDAQILIEEGGVEAFARGQFISFCNNSASLG